MEAFIQHIRQYIASHEFMPAGASLLVACSGGPDSVALALALKALGYKIALAHVNYGLRGEDADADEAFVRKLGKDLGLRVFVRKADPVLIKEDKASLQATARELRYDFFEALMEEHNLGYCATGHTADDQAETSLLSLLRGAGPAVMHGIPAKRGPYLRPLLTCSRAEILDWLELENQPFRTDKSNESNAYLRNRVRHEVLPAMQSVHPMAAKRIREQQKRYDAERSFVEKALEPFLLSAKGGKLDWGSFVERWGEEHLPVLLISVLAEWGVTGPSAEAASGLLHQQVGTGIDTPAGRVVRTRLGISLANDAPPNHGLTAISNPEGFGTILFGESKITIEVSSKEELVFSKKGVHFLDADKIVFPLCLRSWREGDRMQPLGMKGTKLLSDIFIDERYSAEEKARAIILEDALGIICLSGFRVAERVKVQEESSSLIRVVF